MVGGGEVLGRVDEQHHAGEHEATQRALEPDERERSATLEYVERFVVGASRETSKPKPPESSP